MILSVIMFILFCILFPGVLSFEYLSAIVHSQDVPSLSHRKLWHPHLYLAKDSTGEHYEIRHISQYYDVSISFLQTKQQEAAPGVLNCECRFVMDDIKKEEETNFLQVMVPSKIKPKVSEPKEKEIKIGTYIPPAKERDYGKYSTDYNQHPKKEQNKEYLPTERPLKNSRHQDSEDNNRESYPKYSRKNSYNPTEYIQTEPEYSEYEQEYAEYAEYEEEYDEYEPKYLPSERKYSEYEQEYKPKSSERNDNSYRKYEYETPRTEYVYPEEDYEYGRKSYEKPPKYNKEYQGNYEEYRYKDENSRYNKEYQGKYDDYRYKDDEKKYNRKGSENREEERRYNDDRNQGYKYNEGYYGKHNGYTQPAHEEYIRDYPDSYPPKIVYVYPN